MTLDGFIWNAPCCRTTSLCLLCHFFLVGHKRPITVFYDVAMAKMQISRKPNCRHNPFLTSWRFIGAETLSPYSILILRPRMRKFARRLYSTYARLADIKSHPRLMKRPLMRPLTTFRVSLCSCWIPCRPRRQRETEKRKQPWPESMLLSNMPNPINKSPWHGVAPIRIFVGWEAVRAYLPLPVFISGYFSIIYFAWPRMTSPSTSATKTKEFRASSICAREVLYACLNSHNGQSRSVQESPCRQAYLLKAFLSAG